MTVATPWARRLGSASDERGAALFEFAIVVIALFTLFFYIIDGAFYMRARSAVDDAADDAARRAAVVATSDNADFEILRQVWATGVHHSTTIEYVVIYRSELHGDGPNAVCLTGSAVPGECNVYRGSDFSLPEGAFGCSGGAPDGSWCPQGRIASAAGVGVFIQAEYESVTGFAPSFTMSASAELPFESRGGAG